MSNDTSRINATTDDLTQRNEQITRLLDQRYDALNQHLANAESVLKNLRPPHPVWICYEEDYYCEMLGIAKIADTWRLAYGESHLDTEDIRGVKPLSDCPVATRVEACRHLTELHNKIVEAKERYLPSIDAAIQEIERFCQSHTQAGPKPGKK